MSKADTEEASHRWSCFFGHRAERTENMTEKRMSRWYFGGLASCGAACCTHPLDLLKVSGREQSVCVCVCV